MTTKLPPDLKSSIFYHNITRELKEFALHKLESSGISIATAEAEGLFMVPPIVVKTLLHRNDYKGAGLVFNFGGGFHRVRLANPIGDTKYLQRGRTMGRLYIPKTLRREVLDDPTARLYIAEGELKAIKMVQEGFATIGVTGVSGWLHKKEPIPDLDLIAWEGRRVTIVFDSDPSDQSKGNVEKARRWLAAVLTVRGAVVDAIILPDDGTEKVGADDYLVRYGVSAFRELPTPVVPTTSLLIKGEVKTDRYVTDRILSYLSIELGRNSPADFGVGFRSPLNHGQPPSHLTTFIRWGRQIRVRVGSGETKWPLAAILYNLLRARRRPVGRYKMVEVLRQWLPFWQGVLEVWAGDAVVPAEYITSIPGHPDEETLLNAWAMTAWNRMRAGLPDIAFFAPEPFSLMLGWPEKDVGRRWEWLLLYGAVEPVPYEGKAQLYRLGPDRVIDAQALDEWSKGFGREAAD